MKTKWRLTGIILALALCLSLMPIPGWAADVAGSVDTWNGTADTSWYTGHESDTEYHITTAEQLAGLAQLVNADPGKTTFSGKNFYLENDLDLAGHEWISIGTVYGGDQADYSFCGTFDGQGHVISNLYSHDSYTDDYNEDNNLLRNALFGNVYNGEVKNLGVENAEIWIDPLDDSAAGKGILVDWLGASKITNCWTSGSIYSGSRIEKNIGGIVGVTVRDCTISGCYSTATLTGNFTNSTGYYTDPDNLPPDTIGGIIGARFDGNLTVTDCWFSGKIVVNSVLAAVGGIIGYTDTELGESTVENCMVATTDMGADSDGNTCWVAYALGGTAENNYYPDSDKYDVTPIDDQLTPGTAVSDFTSADVLTGLRTNAGAGIEWVAGINHPTFSWDSRNIPADYTAVDEAITAAKAVDSTLYSNYSDVQTAIDAVDRTKNITQQDEVDAIAKAITDAIAALTYKPADYTAVDAAIAKAGALDKSNYKDFSAVEKAIEAVDRTKNITQQDEVDAMAKAITDAISALAEKDPEPTPTPDPKPTPDPTPTKSFKDVSKDAYYYNAVQWAAQKDITNGVAEDLFDPDGTCTRAQLATMLWREAGKPEPTSLASFTDVPETAYYAKAVAWAVERGITLGTGGGKFSPDLPCTRAQALTMQWRGAGKPEAAKSSSFTDVPQDAYYAGAVAWAVEQGVTLGTGDKTFSPDLPCTRAQAVTFLYRAAK